ncbi:MAG: NAD(P)H-dependent glycerol-3-phosphate dehydrogenase [Candidatus Omnitrophota bacterium]
MGHKPEIAILGDGGWGTTLAILLSKKGFSVVVWGAFAGNINNTNKKRVNEKFLPGIKIPKGVIFTSDLRCALKDKDIIVLAVPSQYMRRVLKKACQAGYPSKAVYLSVTKGIEIGSLMRVSEIIYSELGKVKLAVLSGPTIAYEIAQGLPAVAVIASADKKARKFLQGVFMTDRFRVYTNNDVTGVELGGSLKNVIAIACGISDGLGFGANTKAAILARGLAEISRLGVAMGAKASTFSGISGLGDLVTTCISPHSRNRFVGEEVGRGKALRRIHQAGVAEGVPTAKSARALSLKYKVDLPITKEVYNIIYRNKPVIKAFKDLMDRKKKEE